ncbi:MAG: peptide ABC transporter substrate-binding protein, partial [Thalassolituus sp.]
GRSGAYGIGSNDGVYAPGGDTNYCIDGGSSANVNPDYCTDDGYTTKLSGGIRLKSSLDFNNAFAGVNMSPNLSVAYDKGNGPEPGSQFIDDRLTVGVGVSFLYLNQTSVDVSYTNFSGGKYNQLKDRDNISLSAKYSF